MTYRYKLQIGTLSTDGILAVVIFQRCAHILTSYFRLVIFSCLIYSLRIYLSPYLFLPVLSPSFRKLDEVFPTSFHRLPGRR